MNDKLKCEKECSGCSSSRCTDEFENGVCCIDTYRIFDSCRTQECIENAKVYFTDVGQEAINRSVSLRMKSVRVLWTQISTEETPFNTGYYQVNIRYYFYILIDSCMGLGNTQEVQGLAVYDKTVILYGGEGNVSSFKSDIYSQFCMMDSCPSISLVSNLPRAVVEVADPVALKLDVVDEGCPCPGSSVMAIDSIPTQIANCFNGCFSESSVTPEKNCYITIGVFSIIRIERPSQLVIPACDICIPPTCCEPKNTYTDPCSLFRSMDFPLREFYPSAVSDDTRNSNSCDREQLDPANYR